MTESKTAVMTRRLRNVVHITTSPGPMLDLLDPRVGVEYGIGLFDKLELIARVKRNTSRLGAASTFFEQLTVLGAILRIPKSVDGVVAEFGCFKGASTASLSLACAMTGRRLIVFDSFQGLPEPDETIRHIVDGKDLAYRAGDYRGTLDEVKRNVESGGELSVCEFVEGFFCDTLPTRPSAESYALVFEDADLPSSVRDVLRWAWPKLRDGGFFFCHEARDLEVVRIFFDDRWWLENLATKAPGFVGSGLGLPLGPNGSTLGYCVK